MLNASRRELLIGSGSLTAATAGHSVLPTSAQDDVADDLNKYIRFGSKQSGGRGDMACGDWLSGELERVGFTIERQVFSAPFFKAHRSELVSGVAKAAVWAQPIVVPTGADGVTGRLVAVDRGLDAAGRLDGALALIDLPHGRLSSATARPIRAPIAAALAAGARAVVAITNGPTGRLIALNADGRAPMFDKPVALLAPNDAHLFRIAAAQNQSANLVLAGESGRRPAYNFVGRIDRGKSQWIVVSTPRSGWFTCAGERGGGIAVWLRLARWLADALTGYNLAFVCNSGHEYEYLGAAEAMKTLPPKPADTHFWLHLGANVASRDWHEYPTPWQPLPSIDPQRYFSVSRRHIDTVRRIFAGHVGYEVPYASDQLAAGELVEIMKAGHSSAAGVFGLHRFHHVDGDDVRCVSAGSVKTTADAFQALLAAIA